MKAPRLTARTVWIVLAILAAARVISMFPRTMWAWGLNVPRFLDPLIGWGGLAVMALTLAPPVARFLGPRLSSLGDLLFRSALARLVAAALAGVLLWGLPDGVWFLGDFLLRQGTIEVLRQGASDVAATETVFRQALPIDILVHALIPRAFAPDSAWMGIAYSRLLGAVAGALLALLALRFARSLGLTGGAGLAAASSVFFAGHLAFFTGFAKPAAELCLLTVAVVVYGSSLVREGRGGYAFGIALALAFGLHRSALMLAPAWLLAWGMWLQRHRGRAGRMGAVVALVLPAMMLVRALPEILRIAREFDLPRHVLSEEVARTGGPFLAAFLPMRVVDLVNLAVILAPAGLIGLLWVLSASRRNLVEWKLLGAMGVASLPFLFIHPQQGIFRDWDVFATVGTAFCLLAALGMGHVIREENADWLVAPAVASVAVPTLLVLFLHHDVDHGLRRARAFVVEPPGRTQREQALIWDFLGSRSFRLGRWDLAAEAFARDDQFQPTRRVRLIWAMAETMRGNLAGAAEVYSKLLASDPGDPIALVGLGGAAWRLGDSTTFRRAAPMIDAYMRTPAAAKEIRRYLSYYPQVWPGDLRLAPADSVR